MNKIGAIILAAGQGNRFNGKKQFIELDKKPLWKHVYDKVNNFIQKEYIVVVGVDIKGGETRSKSVQIGLNYFECDIDKVIILEAARPLINLNQIKSIIDTKGDSITFMRPLVNTIKNINSGYVDRTEYVELLTPQLFNFKLLKEAYQNVQTFDYTDETRIIYEAYNIHPILIEGDDNLFKVTYPNDIVILERMYERFKEND